MNEVILGLYESLGLTSPDAGTIWNNVPVIINPLLAIIFGTVGPWLFYGLFGNFSTSFTSSKGPYWTALFLFILFALVIQILSLSFYGLPFVDVILVSLTVQTLITLLMYIISSYFWSGQSLHARYIKPF